MSRAMTKTELERMLQLAGVGVSKETDRKKEIDDSEDFSIEYNFPGAPGIYVFWLRHHLIENHENYLSDIIKGYIKCYDLYLNIEKYDNEIANSSLNPPSIEKIKAAIKKIEFSFDVPSKENEKEDRKKHLAKKKVEKDLYCGSVSYDTFTGQTETQINSYNSAKTTKVNVSGIRNHIQIVKKPERYLEKITITGTQKSITFFTDSKLSIDLSGVDNTLVIIGDLDVIKQDVSGIRTNIIFK